MCLGNAMRNQFLMQSLHDKSENLRLANAELTQLARYDAVTGLGNRLSFQWSLQKLLDESLNTKDRVCLFFIDLDGFKGINDLLGHAAGDQMLCQVASSLNTLTSKYRNVGMTAFRLGGDEFTLTLRLSDYEKLAEDVGQEVLHRLAKPMTLNDGDHTISASVGYAISSKDCCDTDVLTRQADTAMYRAKKAGKNRLVKYIEERPKHARSPISLVKPSGENPPSHETDDDTSLDWLDPPRSASNDR